MWELWEGVERLWLLAGEEKGGGGGLKTEYISLLSKLVGGGVRGTVACC